MVLLAALYQERGGKAASGSQAMMSHASGNVESSPNIQLRTTKKGLNFKRGTHHDNHGPWIQIEIMTVSSISAPTTCVLTVDDQF